MIEPDSDLSVSRQCELLGLTRSALYDQPKAPAAADSQDRDPGVHKPSTAAEVTKY